MLGLRQRRKVIPVPLVLALRDQRHELFALLVADGMPQIEAFIRAGLARSKTNSAAVMASNLVKTPSVQARISSITEARKETASVTLPQVTSMLQRVYAGAMADHEYPSAHNAAFSLARLHGLVVDRAQVDVVRVPTREPDAPAERALEGWLQALPSPAPKGLEGLEPAITPIPSLIEHEPQGSSLQGSSPESPSNIKDLADGIILARGDGFGNGAPSPTVTGTPTIGALSEPSEPPEPPERGKVGGTFPRSTKAPRKKKRVPPKTKQVPGRRKRVLKDRGFRELFG